MSGRSARTIRNFSLELSQDLVLLDIRKSTFQHLTVNWNFNVLEMALKTLRFVQGLPRTPLLFVLRYFKAVIPNCFFSKSKLWKSKNLKNLETHFSRFTNKCLVYWFRLLRIALLVESSDWVSGLCNTKLAKA